VRVIYRASSIIVLAVAAGMPFGPAHTAIMVLIITAIGFIIDCNIFFAAMPAYMTVYIHTDSATFIKLVLTAASQLLYTDPLRAIQSAEIEVWLVETDYPLDTTAINAAVRSLEYRDHITLAPDGLTINSGLWQMWLLEHARLPGHTTRPGLPSNRRILLALVAVALLALLIVALAASAPDAPPELPAVPTVTLATGN